MRYSIKLFICILLLLSLTLAVSGNLLMFTSFSEGRTQAVEQAQHDYRLLQYTGAASAVNSSGIRVEEMISVLSKMEGGSRIRVRQDSILLYESTRKAMDFDETLLSYASGETLASRQLTDGDGTHYIQISGYLPIENPSITLDGIFSIEEPYRVLESQRSIYIRVFSVMMVLGIGIAALLQFWLTRPLKKLSAAAQVIAGGEFTVRAEEKGNDEFSVLAADFNRMADRLTGETERQKAFTGAFAHEMKTPMTSVIGYADLIRSGMLEGEEAKDAAGTIFSEGKRLESLSAKLLELLVAGRDGLSLEPCRPGELVRDYVKRNAPLTAEKGIELTEACEEGTAMLDAVLFLSLLGNLAENAARALTGGGHIRLAVNMTEDGFLLSVRDDGPGIPEEALAHLTEAFYRVDKARSRKNGGAGLGLTLCERIAELHNGGLSFRSEPGKGTLVTTRFAAGRGRPSGKGDDRND